MNTVSISPKQKKRGQEENDQKTMGVEGEECKQVVILFYLFINPNLHNTGALWITQRNLSY